MKQDRDIEDRVRQRIREPPQRAGLDVRRADSNQPDVLCRPASCRSISRVRSFSSGDGLNSDAAKSVTPASASTRGAGREAAAAVSDKSGTICARMVLGPTQARLVPSAREPVTFSAYGPSAATSTDRGVAAGLNTSAVQEIRCPFIRQQERDRAGREREPVRGEAFAARRRRGAPPQRPKPVRRVGHRQRISDHASTITVRRARNIPRAREIARGRIALVARRGGRPIRPPPQYVGNRSAISSHCSSLISETLGFQGSSNEVDSVFAHIDYIGFIAPKPGPIDISLPKLPPQPH